MEQATKRIWVLCEVYMKSLVSPSFLKQKARQLKKEKSLSQGEALNEASRFLGFTNYKNYLNILESSRKAIDPIKAEQVISLLKEINSSFKMKLNILESLDSNTIQSICSKISFMNDEIRDHVQKSFLN